MNRKICILLVIVLLGTFRTDGNVLAANTHQSESSLNVLTSEQTDSILRNAKVPEEILKTMDSELKNFIITNSGTEIEYVEVSEEATNTPRSNGYSISNSYSNVGYQNGVFALNY